MERHGYDGVVLPGYKIRWILSAMTQSLADRVTGSVRAEMARRRKTLRSVAAELGENEPWLSRRLTGRIKMTIGDLERIAAVLDLPVSDLIAAPAVSP